MNDLRTRLAGQMNHKAQGVVSQPRRNLRRSDEFIGWSSTDIFQRSWASLPTRREYLSRATMSPAARSGSRACRASLDRSVIAMLNSCRYRGAKLRRSDAGSTNRFVGP